MVKNLLVFGAESDSFLELKGVLRSRNRLKNYSSQTTSIYLYVRTGTFETRKTNVEK